MHRWPDDEWQRCDKALPEPTVQRLPPRFFDPLSAPVATPLTELVSLAGDALSLTARGVLVKVVPVLNRFCGCLRGFRLLGTPMVVSLAFVVLASGALAGATRSSVAPKGPALAILASLVPSAKPKSRLQTITGVVSDMARRRMAIGIYALGVTQTGSELFYGRAPGADSPAPKKPPPPTNGSEVAWKIYKQIELPKWRKQFAAWEAKANAKARNWAHQETANLVNNPVRSMNDPPTTHDLSVGLFRVGQFVTHAAGTRTVLVIIVDEMPPPPGTQIDYGLEGVHVVLVAWNTDDPAQFQSRRTAWKAFFHGAHVPAPIRILARGLDPKDDIETAVTAALG